MWILLIVSLQDEVNLKTEKIDECNEEQTY